MKKFLVLITEALIISISISLISKLFEFLGPFSLLLTVFYFFIGYIHTRLFKGAWGAFGGVIIVIILNQIILTLLASFLYPTIGFGGLLAGIINSLFYPVALTADNILSYIIAFIGIKMGLKSRKIVY